MKKEYNGTTMKAAAQVRLNSIRGRFINKRRIFRKASIIKEKNELSYLFSQKHELAFTVSIEYKNHFMRGILRW